MTFYLIIASFLALGVAVLFGSHYFLYFSLIHFFSITDKTDARILLAVITLLSLSFIISSIIAHIKENSLSRVFYFLSGFWLGFLVNLTLATIFLWIVILAAEFFDYEIIRKPLTVFFYLIALGYSVYGSWNATRPRIKNIKVSIPGLPEHWKNKKMVQLSDLHIGHIFKSSFVSKIVDQINAIKPEITVITGDLFDGMDGNFDLSLKILDTMHSKKGIFFITGNHETFLNTSVIFSALEKTNVRVMRDEVIDLDGLKLIGINYPEHKEIKDPLKVIEDLKPQFSGNPNILLFHTPTNICQFKNSGVNLMLSGHTHRGQIFPFKYIAQILFKGYDYGLHKIDNFTIYITSGAGTWGPTMRTGNAPEIVVITLI
jgi:uncharacterized protein